jgi:hypothetical protein
MKNLVEIWRGSGQLNQREGQLQPSKTTAKGWYLEELVEEMIQGYWRLTLTVRKLMVVGAVVDERSQGLVVFGPSGPNKSLWRGVVFSP